VQALRTAKAQLALLLGVRSAHPEFDVDPAALELQIPAKLAQPSSAALVEEAKKQRPDLLALDQQIERARTAVDLARRQRWPDPQLSLNYAQEGSGNNAVQPPTLTLGLSMGLPIFYQQQGEVAKAQADLRSQELQRAKAEAQVASDVESALAAFEAQRKLAERMRSGLLDRAKRARDLVEVQFSKGAASLLELLDAERTYIATHGEYLQDLTSYWIAVAQLEAATAAEYRP
jgi:cobalt-zinc-cadmium efflux system outer membrane protein